MRQLSGAANTWRAAGGQAGGASSVQRAAAAAVDGACSVPVKRGMLEVGLGWGVSSKQCFAIRVAAQTGAQGARTRSGDDDDEGDQREVSCRVT